MDLRPIIGRLRRASGGENWEWRSEGPWEIMVGAVLVQQTRWPTVDQALQSLRAKGLLTPEALAAAPPERVEACLRPTGFYRTKARRLRHMAARILSEAGSVEAYFARPPEELRRSLLALEGVGDETADVILLYAAGHPSPVVDAYTRRILGRLGLPLPSDYRAAHGVLNGLLPDRLEDHRRFHELMVELGKRYCRAAPECAPCPLLELCPHGQVVTGPAPQAGL